MFGLFSKNKGPIDLWFKTDIHCHVLPGIDDGSPDVATSVDLITGLQDMGIERIYATPHVAAVEFENTPETVANAFGRIKGALSAAGVEMPLEHSAEYRIDENLQSILDNGQIMPYPDSEKHVLIENSWIQEPWNLEEIIFNLQMKGYSPIFAHPERFAYYHNNPHRLDELHAKIPFQINVLSLAGHYGKAIKAMAESLLRKGYADYLGTDTHARRHLVAIREYLGTKDALRHRELSLPTLKNDTL